MHDYINTYICTYMHTQTLTLIHAYKHSMCVAHLHRISHAICQRCPCSQLGTCPELALSGTRTLTNSKRDTSQLHCAIASCGRRACDILQHAGWYTMICISYFMEITTQRIRMFWNGVWPSWPPKKNYTWQAMCLWVYLVMKNVCMWA